MVMHTPIRLQGLTYATPDGRTLFHDLDLAFGNQRTGLIGRNGVGKSSLIKLITGDLEPTSGKIACTGTFGLLRQSVQAGGQTLGDALGVAASLTLLARIEAGDAALDEMGDADWTLPSRIEAVLTELGLSQMGMARPLATLSGGQRTRVALAALLLSEPDMLLLDEPTNNLDADGRAAIAEVLARWRGGAIVVSHDRELLEQMDAIVEMTTLGAKLYGGNWSFYEARKAQELETAEQALASADRKVAELDRKLQAVKERKAHKDAAGKKQRARNDVPKILLNARRNNAENTAGESARIAERLRQEADAAAMKVRQNVEVLQPFAVRLANTGLPSGKLVLHADALSGGYENTRVINGFSLSVTGPERVAVTGPNGSGKTTLLRLLTGDLAPLSGMARIEAPYAMLDQTVSLLAADMSIRDNFKRLNPNDGENACRSALARFLFRADAALQTVKDLSGGEMLRAGLACVLGGSQPPQLLILDEPTNHLDLTAIQAVEAGLQTYDGALLVVSHDPAFLKAVGITRTVTL